MAQITGGKIFYSQTRQAAQFEPKKAEVELSFVVGEGESYEQIAKIAEDFAIAKVQEMIGAKAAPAPKTVQPAPPKPAVDTAPKTSKGVDTTPVAGKEAYAAAQKASVPAAGKKTPPKAAAKVEEKPQISTQPENRADPADMSDVATSDDDILGSAVVVEVPTTISDQDLTSAITKVNQKLNNTVIIRQLVATFVQPPKGSRDIPQEQRAEFIEKLNGLLK